MKGISLIEIIVAIAIIASLSTIGTNTFINIKNDADIDAITDELISDIKLARNKSMNGEILESETENDFYLSDDTSGLPEYGINITTNSYKLKRRCTKNDMSDCSTEDLSTIDDFKEREIGNMYENKYMLEPSGEFFFKRITGNTSPITLTVKEKNDNYKRDINISENFVITITE